MKNADCPTAYTLDDAGRWVRFNETLFAGRLKDDACSYCGCLVVTARGEGSPWKLVLCEDCVELEAVELAELGIDPNGERC